uniref:Uncharacterized protein n=1 Tax=Amphilophus citrinellus TaxID=61819 RepID=A0A3Q0RR36_AMPCI
MIVLFCSYDDYDDSAHHIDIGILLVEHEGEVLQSSLHLRPTSLKLIIEGQVVKDSIKDLPKAICILFGLSYALHFNYPKSMKNTFLFVQQVLLTLGRNLSSADWCIILTLDRQAVSCFFYSLYSITLIL